MKHVRQYHREKKKAPISAQGFDGIPDLAEGFLGGAFSDVVKAMLGRGEQEVITDEYLLGRYIPEDGSDKLVNGHLVQQYVDGDRCTELDGNPPRQVEVRYECNLSKVMDHIIDVTEVSSCHYFVRIGTSRVCSSTSSLPNTNSAIKCFPLVSSFPTSSKPLEDHATESTTGGGTQDRNPDPEHTSKKESRGRKFWKQRLRDFLAHDAHEFPLIHKFLQEFMEAEHLAMPDPHEDLPERLIQKWFALLDVNPDRAEADNGSNEDEDKDGDRKKVLFRIEL